MPSKKPVILETLLDREYFHEARSIAALYRVRDLLNQGKIYN